MLGRIRIAGSSWLFSVMAVVASATAGCTSDDVIATRGQTLDAESYDCVSAAPRIFSLANEITGAAGAAAPIAVKIAYNGPPLADRYQVFVHAVSDTRPEWFDFALFPVPGPTSSQWKGEVELAGAITIPEDAAGTYRLLAGIHDTAAGSGAASHNIRLTAGDPSVRETFGEGAIGYRYDIGALRVSASTSPMPPAPSTVPADWAQLVIDDMTLPSEQTLAAHGTGTMQAYASAAAIGSSGGNFDSIAGICSGTCDHFANNVAGAISWTWIWAGANNRSTHTRVLARHARGFYLSKATGQWVRAFDARPVGSPETIAESTGEGAQNNPDTQHEVDAFTTGLKPDAYYKYELWGSAIIGHAAFTDAKAWFFSTELSLAPDDSGTDDRSDAEFIVKVGADFMTGERVLTPEGGNARYIDVSTGRFVSGFCGTCYPYVAMDGLGGRYRKIPTDGRWVTVTAIAMSPTYSGSQLPPPWGNYSQPSPWAQPPYVLTADEIRANPPPMQ